MTFLIVTSLNFEPTALGSSFDSLTFLSTSLPRTALTNLTILTIRTRRIILPARVPALDARPALTASAEGGTA